LYRNREYVSIDGMGSAGSTTAVDDDRIRITTWTFEVEGANTGHHGLD